MTATASPNGYTYTDGFFAGGIVSSLGVNVDDADANLRPAVNVFNVANFAAPFISEGETRNMFVSLAEAPRGTVELQFSDAKNPDECSFNPATATLTSGNFTNVSIAVTAIEDGIRELAGTDQECDPIATIIYRDINGTPVDALPYPVTTSGTALISIASDEQSISFYDASVGPTANLTTPITLNEGETFSLGVKTLQPPTTGELYNITLGAAATGSFTPSAQDECTLSPATLTLDETDFDRAVTLTAVEDDVSDGGTEGAHGCTITITLNAGSTSTTIPTSTQLVNINADQVASPTLSINDDDTGNDPRVTPLTLVEGATATLNLRFNPPGSTTQTVVLSESSFAPTGSVTSQCSLSQTTFTFGAGDTVPQTVTLTAIDDVFFEDSANPHTCTINVNQNGTDVSSFTVSITDNDSFTIFTTPQTSALNPQQFLSSNRQQITYTLTRTVASNTVLQLTQASTTQPCRLVNSSGTPIETGGVATLTIPANSASASVFVEAVNFNVTSATCNYTGSLFASGAEYTGATVPGIFTIITLTDPNTDPDPTAVPTSDGSSADITPTPQSTADATSEALGTEQAAAATNAPTATPIPRPYIVLDDGINRLPVRTGPYLGASIVTVLLREQTTGGDNTTEDTQYTILAKNRDETLDVFWYFINANNGRSGWVSGLAVKIDLNGD
ncbi:MAG: SH3 domain-containing protein, partial [Chloroflexota bacterium]